MNMSKKEMIENINALADRMASHHAFGGCDCKRCREDNARIWVLERKLNENKQEELPF